MVQKWPIFPILGRIKIFVKRFNASHQVQFQENLMKRYKENIKNVDFGLKNFAFTPLWAKLRIFHNKTVTLNHILMPIIRYNFRKIQWTDLKKSSKVLILDPKMAHFPYFGHNKNFLAKSKTITYPIFDICHLVQF